MHPQHPRKTDPDPDQDRIYNPQPGGDDPLRRPFPKWNADVMELWVDLLAEYSQTLLSLLGGNQSSSTELRETTNAHLHSLLPPLDQAEEAVTMAARLADTAVKETQYRFWLQAPKPKRKSKRKPSRKNPKRTPRRGH